MSTNKVFQNQAAFINECKDTATKISDLKSTVEVCFYYRVDHGGIIEFKKVCYKQPNMETFLAGKVKELHAQVASLQSQLDAAITKRITDENVNEKE